MDIFSIFNFEYDGTDWSLEAATIGFFGTGEAEPPSD
jgi:hypothetical protein